MQDRARQDEVLDCSHKSTTTDPISPGYGHIVQADGSRTSACYPCMDEHARAEFANPNHTKITGYVSEDGTKITTWTGGELAKIVNIREEKTRWNLLIYYYTVVSPDGRRWYGSNGGHYGGPGSAVTLTTYKSSAMCNNSEPRPCDCKSIIDPGFCDCTSAQ